MLKHLVLISALTFAGMTSVAAQDVAPKNSDSLPYPKAFDPAKYLGKWYEIARLPTSSQPGASLATAEYAKGDNDDDVVVKNTAYDENGKPGKTIVGNAKLQPGDPPRLAVGFGPVIPDEANYYVMYISQKYDVAVVGNPDRKSLWILARKPIIGEKRFDRMVEIAEEAGFDTGKLIIADWKSARAKSRQRNIAKRILGTWKYVSGEKDGVDLAAEHLKDQVVEITKKAINLKSPEFNFELNYEFHKESEPHAINLTIAKSPFGAGQKANGILKLEKNMLKLCYPSMGGERPTEFAGPAGSGHHYFLLKRVPKPLTVNRIVGTWTIESGEMGDRTVAEDRIQEAQVEITNDTLTLTSGDATFVMEYELDASKVPAAIRLKITNGPFGEGSTAPGIVKLKGGKLFICYHPRGGEAPTSFKVGTEQFLFVLSRKKK